MNCCSFPQVVEYPRQQSLVILSQPSCIHIRQRFAAFSGFDGALDQLVFIDPDTGFEPSKCEECHVAYRDVSRVLKQLNDNSIVSVFQYQRRKSFSDDLAGIKARLGDCHSTALYWRSLMFVSIAKSPRMIETIAALNQKYATRRERVYVIP